MVNKELVFDFDLYLCERFGYRNACSAIATANGFCVNVRERDLDLYIRFWEYSRGRGNFPDWSIIIVRSNFKENQEENLKDLARFFKEYMPRYGYKYVPSLRLYTFDVGSNGDTTFLPYRRFS